MPIYISGSDGETIISSGSLSISGSDGSTVQILSGSQPIVVSGSDGETIISSGSMFMSGTDGGTVQILSGTQPIVVSGSEGETIISSGSMFMSGTDGGTVNILSGSQPLILSGTKGETVISSGSMIMSGTDEGKVVEILTGSEGIVVSGSDSETKYGVTGSTTTKVGAAEPTFFGSGVVIRQDTSGIGMQVSGTLLQSGSGDTVKLQDNVWIYRLNNNSATLAITGSKSDTSPDPLLKLVRSSSSPSTVDRIGGLEYHAYNNAGEETKYGGFLGTTTGVTNGSEDFKLQLQTVKGGTMSDSITLLPTETIMNDAGVNVDFRVESDLSASMLIVSGAGNAVGVGFGASHHGYINATFHNSGSTATGVKRIGPGNTHTLLDDATVYIFTASAPTHNIMTATMPRPIAGVNRIYSIKSLHNNGLFYLAVTGGASTLQTGFEGSYGGIKLQGTKPGVTLVSDGTTWCVLNHTGTLTTTP
jgi:hypothetical protein